MAEQADSRWYPCRIFYKCFLFCSQQYSSIVFDVLLDKLKRGEKDGIDDAGPAHRHGQAAVHVALEKGNLGGGLDFFAAGVEERVALVDALGRVDGV